MSIPIYYNVITPSSWTADEEATGYEIENLDRPAVGRPWRSTTTGAVNLLASLGSLMDVHAVLLQHVNFAACTLRWRNTTSSPTGISIHAVTSVADDLGQYRASDKEEGQGVEADEIQISIASGTPVDGAEYWSIGAVYILGSTVTLDRGIRPGLRAPLTRPGESRTLANGRPVRTTTGTARHEVSFTQRGLRDDDLGELIRLANQGVVVADLGVSTAGRQPWQWFGTTIESTVEPTYREVSGTLSEVV